MIQLGSIADGTSWWQTHASRKPRNCGPFAFISVIMRNRAEVRCSTRCTRACCIAREEFSQQDGWSTDEPSKSHLASDGGAAIGRHVRSLCRHQRSLPAQRRNVSPPWKKALKRPPGSAPDASCGDCNCLRLNRPRALAVIAGELARSYDAPPNNLHRQHALAPVPRWRADMHAPIQRRCRQAQCTEHQRLLHRACLRRTLLRRPYPRAALRASRRARRRALRTASAPPPPLRRAPPPTRPRCVGAPRQIDAAWLPSRISGAPILVVKVSQAYLAA